MDLGLQEKVAIVMAASKGLGRACAGALAAGGARVTIGARGAQALEKTAQEIQQATGSHVLAVSTDVTRAEDMEAIVASTVREFGRIDILINNAGGPPAGTFDSLGFTVILASATLASETQSVRDHTPADRYSRIRYVPRGECVHRQQNRDERAQKHR